MFSQVRCAINNARTAIPKHMTRSQSASFCTKSLCVEHDEKQSLFVINMESHTAFIQYAKNNNFINLQETEVPTIFQGKGVGKLLAEAAFKYVADNNLKMKIECTYLQHYLEKYSPEHKRYLA